MSSDTYHVSAHPALHAAVVWSWSMEQGSLNVAQTIHSALHATVFASKALRTQRPNAFCSSCQVHGAAGGGNEKQSYSACASIWQCCSACDAIWQRCSACCATFARAEQEKRTIRNMDRCRSPSSGRRVRVPVGRPKDNWGDVMLPPRFDAGPL